MVSRTKQGGTGAALTLIAVLVVSMAPLNLPPADVSLASLSPDNVYAVKNVVEQGEPVSIYFSQLILSESVGVVYFVIDFHDNSGIYYFNNLKESTRSVQHTYTRVGSYDVTVLALRGNISRAFTVPITVVPASMDIGIQADVDNPIEDQEIVFRAFLTQTKYDYVLDSSMPETYVWEFGDGQKAFTSQPVVKHSYNNSGDYTVRLRAYTNDSLAYTDFYDLTVANRIPDVTIVAPSQSSEASTVQFTANVGESVSDRDTLVYIWDFGDGTYAAGRDVSHQYFDRGNYTVKLSVIDDDGSMGTDTQVVTIGNVAPQIAVVSDKLGYYEGETAITVVNVNDTYNDIPYLKYLWNVNAEGQQASIPMLDNGIYTFSVNVSDDNGAWDYAETEKINIVNIAPVVSLIDAYSVYNVTFKLYGTVGVEVNMTFFTDDVQVWNTSLTSSSVSPSGANTTTFYNIRQNLLEYSDILYYVNNKTSSYDNYVVTTFSFIDAPNVTIINHCQSNKACSAITWRTPVAPLDRGFPVTMDFEYFDPGDDNVTVGVDFGTNSYSVLMPSNGTANYGLTSVTGRLPYGEHPSNVVYWVEDDDGARGNFTLPLRDNSRTQRPPGFLNTTAWERWGHSITHYAPGAFISLGTGGYNVTTWDDELFEGIPKRFNVDPMYASPETLNYEWHFGDGTPIVKEKSPEHMYEYSGRYLVWVLISDGIYKSVSYQWMDVINQLQSVEPIIVGDWEEGMNLNFTVAGYQEDIVQTSHYNFIWDFGDGRREFGQNVTHTYQESGNFTMSVTMIDEHQNMETFTVPMSIFPSAPSIEVPLEDNVIVNENNNIDLRPQIVESAVDRLSLVYRWELNGTVSAGAFLNRQLSPGNYSLNLVVTDNDGWNYTQSLNITVIPTKTEVTLTDYQLYGRTIGRNIILRGTLSPSIFDYSTIMSRTLEFILLGKDGQTLDSGTGYITTDLHFTANVSLEGIYDEDALNSINTSATDVNDIISTSPDVISGDYVLRIILKDGNDTETVIHRNLKVIADQDGDILPDELEILLASTVDVELDPLKEDTDENGISDSVEFLLADDPDGDGLPSILENSWGSDPHNPDTDGDGLQDGYGPNGFGELTFGTDPLKADTDGDGLSDLTEVVGWNITVYYKGHRIKKQLVTSSPLTNDTDGDGLSDYFERTLLSDPRRQDTDRDRIDDNEERNRGTIPYRYDSDRDGLSDYEEVFVQFKAYWIDVDDQKIEEIFYTNPLNPDTDGDGLTDFQEVRIYHSVATNPDTDGDHVKDLFELRNRTSITNADTDGDKLSDGAELYGFEIPFVKVTRGIYDENGNAIEEPVMTNKTIIVKTNPLLRDTDGDGLSDYDELMGQNNKISNPTKVDSDGDGLLDNLDPYPIVPDYAPPAIVTNVYGEQGIHLYYKVGDHSIVGNVKRTLTSALSNIWGLMKSVGSLVSDILDSIFYWKCKTVLLVEVCWPVIRSMGEIKNRVKQAVIGFVSSSRSRLNQIFSGFSSLGTVISKSFSFSGFGLSVSTNSIGLPTGISVSGTLRVLATLGTKVVKALVDPTVNVKFTVRDDVKIKKILVYKDRTLIDNIWVNAKTYNFDRDYAILTDSGGSTSTTFIFVIIDINGNEKVIERSDSVINFVDKIANQVVETVKSVIDTIVDWATDIAQTAINAIVEAANAVADAALSIYNAVRDFFLNAIPDLFRSFIINTIGKYLKEKYDDAQTAISMISTTYLSSRQSAVDAIDGLIDSLGIVKGINESIYKLQELFDQYLPPLDPDEVMDKLSGGSDFLHLDFLSGTIFEYVIDFMKDGFMSLLQSVISDLVEDLVGNALDQYLQPFKDVYNQLMDVFISMGIPMDELSDSSGFDQGSTAIATLETIISQLLAFANMLRNPAETVTPYLNAINGDNLLKVLDTLLVDDPTMLISLFDITRSLLTPVAMLGMVTYDIITWTGSLFSVDSISKARENPLEFNLLGIPRDARKIILPTAPLDSAIGWARAISVIKLIWKAYVIGMDTLLAIVVSTDRSDDGKLIPETVVIDFIVAVEKYVIGMALDITIDALYGKPVGGSGSFREKTAAYITNGMGILLKGIFLAVIKKTCTPAVVAGGAPSCSTPFFTPTNYDIFGNILDFLIGIASMVFTIVDFAGDSGVSTAVFVLKMIVAVMDLIFIPANYFTNFGQKLSSPEARAIYMLIYVAKGVVDWVADLIDILNNW